MQLMCSKRLLIFIIFFICRAQGSSTDSEFIANIMDANGKIHTYGANAPTKTPLGSLYKLFVYAYLSETAQPERSYVCRGQDPNEIFCCHKGEAINRETALAKSCTPYFSYQRLKINTDSWKSFWIKKLRSSPAWISDVKKMKPETIVDVAELLNVLSQIREQFITFKTIESAVVKTVIAGTAADALKSWGSLLRVKTYTWRDADLTERIDKQGFTGGFAGWVADGSAIWVSTAGHGKNAFKTMLKPIIEKHMNNVDTGCVLVSYFDDYPIAMIKPTDVYLRGPVHIKFKNGNQMKFIGDGSLRVDRFNGKISIRSQLTINSYLARVLQREVGVSPPEAAKAFAVVMRTYLLQNSKEVNGCRKVTDSTKFQRVSPEAESPEALSIVRWSDGLILDHIKNIRYHATKSEKNRISWTYAKTLALNGFLMNEILKTSFPIGELSFEQFKNYKCEHNFLASNWIKRQSINWRKKLVQEVGYEEPKNLTVCLPTNLIGGTPYFANLQSEQIFVPSVRSSEDELSILHEYLHIAFRNHPNGHDEKYIEGLARKLQEDRWKN